MKRRWLILLAVLALAGPTVAGWLSAHKGATAGDSDNVSPTASITVAPVTSSVLTDVATAYGTVQANPTGVVTITAPRQLIVRQVDVAVGQTVRAGQALMSVASAPAATMAYRQAQDAERSAASDLARVQRLFAGRLASSDQVTAAKRSLADAEAALDAQEQQGSGAGGHILTAPRASVVTAITASSGDRVAQDAVLLTLARRGAVNVRLGLEPGKGAFAAGDRVVLKPTSGGAAIDSRLSVVGETTDPATRAVDATAPLRGSQLPIGSGVEADIITGTHHGLTVPRPAVVFDETGDHIFVVRNGKAERVFVTVGRDYGDRIEVDGPISPGEEVAVTGAYELQDGMAVRVAAR